MKTFQQPEIMTHFRVDGVVCLVDSMFLKDHINEAVQQVAFADKILLNKTDLVSKAEMKQLKETVTSINSFAEQIETRNSRVDLGKIIGINAFSLERMAGALDEYESEEDDDVCTLEGCTHDHEHGHGHADAHGHSEHEGACDDACAPGEAKPETHGHGHAEAAESEHGHAEAPAVVAHTEHGHAEKPKKPKKLKKHDISGQHSWGGQARDARP